MPVHELFTTIRGTDGLNNRSTDERHFVVSGTDDVDTALAELVAYQADWRGLKYDAADHEYIAPETWLFRVHYVDPDQSDREHKLATGSYRVSFDTTGQTARRKVAYQQTAFPFGSNTAPNLRGAIGVDDDRKVEGVDVVIPGLKFSITYRQPKAVITNAYVKTLASLTGKTNNAAFYGFAAQEVLFLGASGHQGSDSDPEVSYNFLASVNVTGLEIAGVTGISKAGHDYLWPYYETATDSLAQQLVPRPHTVFVAKVYESSDFSALQIGA